VNWVKGLKEISAIISRAKLRIVQVAVGGKDYHVRVVTCDKSEVYCYTGQCVEFSNAISEGKNLGELKENMKEAIETTLEPLPDNVVKSSARVSETIAGEKSSRLWKKRL
jgi:predicted RNase H-like HicB family nuclease